MRGHRWTTNAFEYSGDLRNWKLLKKGGKADEMFNASGQNSKAVNRPGGVHRTDFWRIGQLNEHMGDYLISDIKKGCRTSRFHRNAPRRKLTLVKAMGWRKSAENAICAQEY